MRHLTIVLAACALLALPAQAAATATGKDSEREARAAFIKKCFRDRTRQACEAPPAARLRQ